MDNIRYTYRYIRNSIIRLLGLLQGGAMDVPHSAIIISPHPDDEVLGCGGLISHLKSKGCKVSIVMLTGGENCDNSQRLEKETLKIIRRNLTREACSVLGVMENDIYFLDFKDGGISKQDAEIEKLRNIIDHTDVTSIFVPHLEDGWSDHVEAHLIIKEMISNRQLTLYAYCVWFWYTMPFGRITSLQWNKLNYFKMSRTEQQNKKKAIDIYMDARSPEGIYYSGILPKILIKSCLNKYEFYFKMTR